MAVSDSVSLGKIKRRKKTAARDKIFYVFIYSFFVLFAVLTLYPVIHILALSFNERYDAVTGGIYIFPRRWDLRNYYEIIFEKTGIQRGMLTTVARTVIGTFTALGANALLAFILSRKRFLFRSGLSLFWVITMYASGGIVTTYILYRYLHFNNTFWVYIIPGLVSAFYVLAIRTYMSGIPDSVEEAALLEGAGYMRVFWSIISPLCKPVYAAVALFIAVNHWNSWFDALLYNRFEPRYTTLQYEMMKLFSELRVPSGTVEAMFRRSTSDTERAAAYVLVSVPVIVAYPFFQKYFVAGLSIRGVKD